MVIQFRCKQCGQAYKIADEKGGKRVKCKSCSAVMRIPAPVQQEPEPEEDAFEDISRLAVRKKRKKTTSKQETASPRGDDARKWYLIGGGGVAILLFVGLCLYLFLPAGEAPVPVANTAPLQPVNSEPEKTGPPPTESEKPVESKPTEMQVAEAAPSEPKPEPEPPVEPVAPLADQQPAGPMSAERFQEVGDTLRNLTNAFHNYYGTYQGFLPDPKIYKHYYDERGRLKLSWRVHLLPYVGEEVLFHKFRLDESWDSPMNQAAAKYMPKIYRSPETPADSNLTRFRGFEDLATTEGSVQSVPAGRSRRGRAGSVASIFTVGSRGRMRDIIDGTSNTILIIEAGPDQAVEWTKPEELDLAKAAETVGTSASGIPIVFVDGGVRLLKPGLDDKTWRSAIHPADRGVLDFNELTINLKRPVKVAAPDRSQIMLNKLSIGFMKFHDKHRRFPPSSEQVRKGKPLLSWRVHLLPFLNAHELYAQFKLDEPWDSPHNSKLLKLMPDVYESAGVTSPGQTSIMTFSGPGTPFQPDQSGPSLGRIQDGTAYTILLVNAGPDKAVPWTKPEDLPLDPDDPVKSLGRIPGERFSVVLMDGSVRKVKTDIPAEQLKNLINHKDGNLVGDF